MLCLHATSCQSHARNAIAHVQGHQLPLAQLVLVDDDHPRFDKLLDSGFAMTTNDEPWPSRTIQRQITTWRWASKPFQNAQPGETGPAGGDGYCGMAGKP